MLKILLIGNVASKTETNNNNMPLVRSYFNHELCEVKLLGMICDFVCGTKMKLHERRDIVEKACGML